MPSSPKQWGEAYARKADAFAATDHWRKEALCVVEHMLEHTPDSGTVLDFGCNTGRFLEMAMDVAPTLRYYGVDVNEDGLDIARKRLPHVPFGVEVFDVLEPESVDFVACIHTLPQVETEILVTVLSELWHVMKRGAHLSVVVHNKWQDLVNKPRNLFNGYKGDSTISQEFTAGSLKQTLWDAGFLCDDVFYFGPGRIPLLRNRIIFHGRKAS